MACCGVIPHTDALVLDEDFKPENVNAAIDRGLQSPLLNWLHLRGPYGIMKWMSERYNLPIPVPEAIGGNCEACSLLFHTKEIADKIEQAVSENVDEISGELYVLDALGLLKPRPDKATMHSGVVDLWMDQSIVGERSSDVHLPNDRDRE